ncbi:hypothetical protein Phi19:3_gp055 [Cellulophaga phage phi19:3]|uniref:Uncharacterized protein n=1 Tax=Cellulophaga phage phi19:3 TaxID=1327971 RepID=R9ZW88_9CAUD|nr:hypothetical protein Phi19:3_gp055 [Cellulophaga phage phi19:3]AGO47459.1 hypothetical protein Phi19:3_gp055 [Cellulophaga phage phi19:3]
MLKDVPIVGVRTISMAQNHQISTDQKVKNLTGYISKCTPVG